MIPRSLSFLPFLLCAAAGAPEVPRRNVLLLAIDDLRPSLGCMGDPVARTPHIDALAAEGLVFERHYSQLALCNPSRSTLLTGLRPRTIRVLDLGTDFRHKRPGVVTLPQVLRSRGYLTLAMGKVHHDRSLDDALSWSEPPFWPPAGHYHTEAARAALEERGRWLEENGYSHRARGPATESPDLPGVELVDGVIATEAVRRLEELAQRPEPFFLAVGFKKPHLPFVAPKECWERYDPETLPVPERVVLPEGAPEYAGVGVGELRAYVGSPLDGPLTPEETRRMTHAYYACVSHVDDQIGRVLAALEEQGLAESTVVVLWSDHGYQLGELGQWCKHTNYETALRCPLIVRVPDSFGSRYVRGRSTLALVETVDLYPTLMQLCGMLPANDLEGTSFLPLLENPDLPWKVAAFSEYPRNYAEHEGNGIGISVRTAEHRLTLWRAGREILSGELYEYGDSLLEAVNRVQDPDWSRILRRMRSRLARGWKGARAGLPGVGPEPAKRPANPR